MISLKTNTNIIDRNININKNDRFCIQLKCSTIHNSLNKSNSLFYIGMKMIITPHSTLELVQTCIIHCKINETAFKCRR